MKIAPAGRRQARVANVNDKVIQVVFTDAAGKESDETYTPEWNPVATVSGIYYPHLGQFKFPLQVGGSYELQFEMVFASVTSARVLHVHTAKVVGWKEVMVPAGKFRAIKIETQGTFQRLDLNLEGTARFVIWYVPEVRRWVKFMYEDNVRVASQLKPGTRLVDELVEFKPNKVGHALSHSRSSCAPIKKYALEAWS